MPRIITTCVTAGGGAELVGKIGISNTDTGKVLTTT
jgi:hypothetical protein